MRPTTLTERDLLIFLALVVVVLALFYRYVYRQEARQARRLTGSQTFSLWLLRIVVAFLALLALARPAIHRIDREERLPVAAFLVDVSSSMGFPTGIGDVLVAENAKSRRTRLDSAMKAVERVSGPLSLTHRVKVYTGADTARLLKEIPHRKGPGTPALTLEEVFRTAEEGPKLIQAKGGYTQLGDGLKDIMRQLSADKIASIIMVGDGRQTGGAKLDDVVKRAAEQKVPIHTITTGTEFQLRDLRIDEVIFPPEASLGDVLTFRLTVTNQIRSQLEVKLTLKEEGSPITKTLVLKRGQNRVSISTIPQVKGWRRFHFSLPVQRDEVDEKNNEDMVRVNIVKRTLSVILIAGRPSREYLYVVPALLRDPIVKLSCYLQTADVDYTHQGNRNIDRLPKNLKEWQPFDVAILQDVDPKGITAQQIAGLENMVNKGGGLVFQAGRNFGLAKLVQVHAARIRGLLPVEIDKNLYPDYDKYFSESWKTRRTPLGKGHPIMFASTDEKQNERLWDTFPRFFWHHPVEGPKHKAITILERGGSGKRAGTCLMAIQRYGEGAVFFSAIDSLWRWRYPYENFDYDRLWTRIVRYLGETRLMGKQQQVRLGTTRNSYSPGEKVVIRLEILDPALMKQLAAEQVYVSVTSPKGDTDMVRLQPRRDGQPVYEGAYRARAVGSMWVRARQIAPEADTEQKPLFDEKHSFQVKLQSLESKDTSADLKAMEEVARMTGGKHFNYKNLRNIADLDSLAEVISPEPQVLKRERQVEVWDGVPFLVLFLVLISGEWCLRKLWGLL